MGKFKLLLLTVVMVILSACNMTQVTEKEMEPIVGIPDGKYFISETTGRERGLPKEILAFENMFSIKHIDEDVAIEMLQRLEEDFGLTYKTNLGSKHRDTIYLEDNGMKIERVGWYNGTDSEMILKKTDDVVSFGENVAPYIELVGGDTDFNSQRVYIINVDGNLYYIETTRADRIIEIAKLVPYDEELHGSKREDKEAE